MCTFKIGLIHFLVQTLNLLKLHFPLTSVAFNSLIDRVNHKIAIQINYIGNKNGGDDK